MRQEGNKGGDYIILEKRGRGMVYVEVGHCCVVHISALLPVEIITATLARELSSKKVQEWDLPWDNDYNDQLRARVKFLDFFGRSKNDNG